MDVDPLAHVVIAEDDRAVRESLLRALTLAGHDVAAAANGQEALDLIAERTPDLVVLDLMMPGLNGLDVCRTLRSSGSSLPILMVTARDAVADRVAGLDAGADDYLVKPFSLDELLARVRALLRRAAPSGTEGTHAIADLKIDTRARRVTRGDTVIELTKTEFDLLELLVHNADVVLSRDTIYERIWGYDFETGSKSLDVYVGYLRRKLEARGEPRLIHTVRGVGYVARVGP